MASSTEDFPMLFFPAKTLKRVNRGNDNRPKPRKCSIVMARNITKILSSSHKRRHPSAHLTQ